MMVGDGWSAVQQYGAFSWPEENVEPTVTSVQTTSHDVTIGLPSPLGDKIPQGIGTYPVNGQLIVNPNLLGGVAQSGSANRVNIVLGFAETTLGGTVTLVNLKANDEYIYRTEAPLRNFAGTMRFYGGNQTTLDPLLSSKLTNPTYWPRLAYVVLENFDIAPYDNQLPSFQAELSSVAEVSTLNTAEATLTFGDTHGSGSEESAVDRIRNHVYVSDIDGDDIYVMTIDTIANIEINRAKIVWTGGTYDYIGMWVALEGSDYIVGRLVDSGDSSLLKLALINTATGIVSVVQDPNTSGGDPAECTPLAAQLVTSGVATKYILYSTCGGDIDPNSSLVATVVDITNSTMTDIVHPYVNPVVTDGRLEILGLVAGPVINGQAVMFYIPSNGNSNGTVWKLVLSDAGLISAQEIYTGADCRGVAYDWTDATIVVYREDTNLVKVNQAGAVLYTVNTGIVNLRINYNEYETGGQFHYSARDGYAAGSIVFGSNGIYLIDLSNGSTQFIIDEDDYITGQYTFYDQIHGLVTVSTADSTPSGMTRYALPLASVPTVDLQNIYTKLAVYRGKFSSGDLEFDGFLGGECYGVVYASDTTLDNAEQDANQVFDVKIVPSDGKRKYRKAKRDGSFSIDDTITSTSIIEQSDFNIKKTMLSDEQSLVGSRISYIDKNANFERTEQEYRRPIGIYNVTRSDRVEDVSTSFVMNATQALQAVTTKVYRSNFGLDVYTFTLAPKKFYLEPADIVEFDFEGFTVVGQINDATLSGEMFTQDVTITQYVQAIDTTFVGSEINVPPIDNPSLLTRFTYLDGPLLSPGDDLGGAAVRQYAMLSGYGYGTFPGATLYRSFDGNSYSVVTSRFGVTPVLGVLRTVTGSPSAAAEAIDHTTSLQIAIVSGDTADLATITEAEMLTGRNKAIIGNVGRWIIIYFQTVVLTDKLCTISNIVWSSPFYQTFLDSLVSGDYFVLLQPGHHVRFSGDVTKLGDSIFYKAASDAFPLTSVTTEAHNLVGRAEMPFPPLHLNAAVAGSDLALSWDWRSRLHTGSILPGSDNSPLGEATLAFEIDIMDGSTVKRTLTATTNSKTYLAADMTTDFGSMPDPLTFRVYQMSALVGRGYRAEKTVSFGGAGVVGTAAGVGAASGVARSIRAGAGSAAGVGAASAVGRETKAVVGSAVGAGAASSVGRSINPTVGSAAGVAGGTAVGLGLSSGDYVGSAAGTSTASGVGAPRKAVVGSSSGVGAASGVGKIIKATVGSSAGVGAASGVGAAVITDPNFSSVVFLAGFNGANNATSSSDESAAGHALTFNGNAKLDTGQLKFGASSLTLDGTGDYITCPDSPDWNMGTGQFTVEMFVRHATGFSNNEGYVGQWSGVTDGWFLFRSGGSLTMRIHDSGGTNRDTAAVWNPTVNTWYHIACDRDASNKVRVYVDGVMIASSTVTQSFADGTGLFGIGAIPGFIGSYDLQGWIDEVRITKGVARYASDSGYTVPTAAFPRS
jgi:hypothetical protein